MSHRSAPPVSLLLEHGGPAPSTTAGTRRSRLKCHQTQRLYITFPLYSSSAELRGLPFRGFSRFFFLTYAFFLFISAAPTASLSTLRPPHPPPSASPPSQPRRNIQRRLKLRTAASSFVADNHPARTLVWLSLEPRTQRLTSG